MKKSLFTTVLLALLSFTLIFTAAGCGGQQEEPAAEIVVVTDMAGREVKVPAEIDSVFATGAVGTVFMYTLAPDMIAGWNDNMRVNEQEYIAEKYWALPGLGTWKGSNFTGNLEDLIAAAPDIIISMGDVSEQYTAEADAIAELAGIPVIMVDGSIYNLDKSYEFLGGLLGVEERAGKLADYCRETLSGIETATAGLSEEQKVRLYYGEGVDGLDTEVAGSLNSEAIEAAGAVNVAEAGVDGTARITVSVEQVATWDPAVIIVSSDGDADHTIYHYVRENKAWSSVAAVKNGTVYEVPAAPYDWINRPPSVARMIGVQWLANLLYPELYDVDISAKVAEFFSLFYQYELTTEDAAALLALAK